jgi:hypothetical protein
MKPRVQETIQPPKPLGFNQWAKYIKQQSKKGGNK